MKYWFIILIFIQPLYANKIIRFKNETGVNNEQLEIMFKCRAPSNRIPRIRHHIKRAKLKEEFLIDPSYIQFKILFYHRAEENAVISSNWINIVPDKEYILKAGCFIMVK